MSNKDNENRAMSDAELEAVSGGGIQNGGAWRAVKGSHVYDGWAKDGSAQEKYTSTLRREYGNDGKVRYFSHDGKLVRTASGKVGF